MTQHLRFSQRQDRQILTGAYILRKLCVHKSAILDLGASQVYFEGHSSEEENFGTGIR